MIPAGWAWPLLRWGRPWPQPDGHSQPAWTLLVLGPGYVWRWAKPCTCRYVPPPTTPSGTPEEPAASGGGACMAVMGRAGRAPCLWGRWPGTLDDPFLLQVYPPGGLAATHLSPRVTCFVPILVLAGPATVGPTPPSTLPQITPLSPGSLCTLCKKV